MKRSCVISLALMALAVVLVVWRMPAHRRLQLRNLLEQAPSLPARYMV